MDAKHFYDLRHTSGFSGFLSKTLVFVFKRIRLPHPYPQRRQHIRAFRRHLGGRGRILMLGSNYSRQELSPFDGNEVVQLDIKQYPNVDIVLDAESMSDTIPPGSFDYVVSMKMLEHTLHPWRVVSEIFKILKPGGVMYLSVPWIYPLHGEPSDYWRFSVPCLKELVRDAGMEEIESGSEISGHGSLHIFLKAYLSEIFSFSSSIAYYCLEYLTNWLLFPLGLLELLFRLGRRQSYHTDCIVFIIARKPAHPHNS